MSVFDFDDYKEYFNSWVQDHPNNGHGEYRRAALHLNVSTTMISQVFKGPKDLSLEMAIELCDYLNMSEEESEYFLLLVSYSRSGSTKLKMRLLRQIGARQEKARKLETRLKKDTEMDEEAKAIFYSNWMYSGVRMLTAIDNMDNATVLSQRLNLPKNQVQKILDFLVANGLVIQKAGRLRIGPAKTHIGSSNVLVNRHHQNWRLQGFNKMLNHDDKNLFYTGPMNLSVELADKIRQELPSFIENLYQKILPSKGETVRCLNIDWFEY